MVPREEGEHVLGDGADLPVRTFDGELEIGKERAAFLFRRIDGLRSLRFRGIRHKRLCGQHRPRSRRHGACERTYGKPFHFSFHIQSPCFAGDADLSCHKHITLLTLR